jgi:hypothetical protein
MSAKIKFTKANQVCPVCGKAELLEVWHGGSSPSYYHCLDTTACKSRFVASERIEGNLSSGFMLIPSARLLAEGSNEYDLAGRETQIPSKKLAKKSSAKKKPGK